MDIRGAIDRVVNRIDLRDEEMQSVMRTIMQGDATPAQIGGLLIGLRMKGETVEEIAAAARVMREFALKVDISCEHLVDIVGTGGDGVNTFNISTTAAFVIAAAGGRVAKHNNRSVSSRSGSADVLEQAGVKLGLTPAQVVRCIEQIGIGFMFAPAHHSATRHAAGPRKELGTRTLFNLLGPLTNPACALHQLLGVYDPALIRPLAMVMQNLGSVHVLVVNAEDGMDEISISAPTRVAELCDGVINEYTITPEQFGIARGKLSDLTVHGVTQSLDKMYSVLNNDAGPARDIVVLNAGAAIYAADLTDNLQAGIDLADAAIKCGGARTKLDELVSLTTRLHNSDN